MSVHNILYSIFHEKTHTGFKQISKCLQDFPLKSFSIIKTCIVINMSVSCHYCSVLLCIFGHCSQNAFVILKYVVWLGCLFGLGTQLLCVPVINGMLCKNTGVMTCLDERVTLYDPSSLFVSFCSYATGWNPLSLLISFLALNKHVTTI